MKDFKCGLFLILFQMVVYSSLAQEIKKNIVVEHFTNTRCSNCASSNPGFFNAKNQSPEILHIAYHPSVPYNTCLFNTQNKSENDARTIHYNVFFGTPTFLINGEFKSSSAMQNSSVYNPFKTQTSAFDVKISFVPTHADSIKVNITVEAVAQHNFGVLSLYIPLLEDTVLYNAPNGENKHYDVFRKSFSGDNDVDFTAPALGEPPYVYSSTIKKNDLWDLNRLSAVAIVSNGLSVIQAQKSAKLNANLNLPLDWVDVNVKSIMDGHDLTWTTINEINVSHFEVERRITNEEEFSFISEVKATGGLNDKNQYNFIDHDIYKPGVYIYRVKQVDFDGKFTWSKAVKVTNSGNIAIKLYPSPATDESNVFLTVDSDSKVEINIFDRMGRSVAAFKESQLNKFEENIFNLKLWNIPSGLYIADINVNDISIKKKLIKL